MNYIDIVIIINSTIDNGNDKNSIASRNGQLNECVYLCALFICFFLLCIYISTRLSATEQNHFHAKSFTIHSYFKQINDSSIIFFSLTDNIVFIFFNFLIQLFNELFISRPCVRYTIPLVSVYVWSLLLYLF